MFLIANGTQVESLPAPRTPVGTPGYAFNGDPSPGQTLTELDPDTANTLLEEIRQVVAAASLALDQNNRAQLLAAIRALISEGAVTTFNTRGPGAITLLAADVVAALGFTPVQQGTGAGQNPANNVRIGYDSAGPGVKCEIDVTDFGYIAFEGWVLGFNYATEAWVLGLDYITSAGAPVQSVFGRSGNVLAAPGGQSFTTPGTFTLTVPANVSGVNVTVTGGGAGGTGNTAVGSTFNSAGGGGAGGTAIGSYAVTPGSSIVVVVGAGGSAGGASNAWGTNGGTSSFGSYCSATGGAASEWSTSTNCAGGQGGTGAGGTLANIAGGDGTDGQAGSQCQAGDGGASFWGGGGRAGANGGLPGVAPGSGGGGSYGTSGPGGAGPAGIVVVEWIA